MSYYKSERNFRRYEAAIETIIAQYPSDVSFTPEALACTTYAARLSDAMTAVMEADWPTRIDKGKLRTIRRDLNIFIQDGRVHVRAKKNQQRPDQVDLLLETNELNTLSLVELDAIALLVGNQRMKKVTMSLTPEMTSYLRQVEASEKYNISVVNNDDGTFTIL